VRTNSPRKAAHEWRDEIRRQHMLDLASTYQRTADALAPPSPRELLIEHLRERNRAQFADNDLINRCPLHPRMCCKTILRGCWRNIDSTSDENAQR